MWDNNSIADEEGIIEDNNLSNSSLLKSIDDPEIIRAFTDTRTELSSKGFAYNMVNVFMNLLPEDDNNGFWSNPEQEIEEENSLRYLFQVMRDQEVTIDTLVIMLQCMYFTKYGVYLVTTPMHVQGVSSEEELVQITHYSINKQSFGGSANFKAVEFDTYFKQVNSKEDSIKVEPGVIVFSSKDSAQFVTNLVNTGKTHATLFARAWTSIFGDVFKGISYKGLARFIKDIGGVNFNIFMYDWGFHRKNSYYLQTETISVPTNKGDKQGRASLIKQFFENVETNNGSVSKYMDYFKQVLVMVGINKNTANSYTVEIFANKQNNGFFAVPHKAVHLVMQMLVNGLLTELNHYFINDILHVDNLLKQQYLPSGLQVQGTSYNKLKESYSQVYNSTPYNIYKLSFNTGMLIPNVLWRNKGVHTRIVTEADVVLLLVALFKQLNLNDLKEYAQGIRQKSQIGVVSTKDYQHYVNALSKTNPTVKLNSKWFNKAKEAVKNVVKPDPVAIQRKEEYVKQVIFKLIPDLKEVADVNDLANTYVGYDKEQVIFNWELMKTDMLANNEDDELNKLKEDFDFKTLKFNSKHNPKKFILKLLEVLLEL